MTTTVLDYGKPQSLDAADPEHAWHVTKAMENRPVLNHYGAALYPLYLPEPKPGEDPAPPIGYVLWWTDYVANDWAEYLPTLPIALARFAALVEAGTREAFYVTPDPAPFVEDLTALFEKHAVTV